jgi:hypothetical protein
MKTPDFGEDLPFGQQRERELLMLAGGWLVKNNLDNPKAPDLRTASGELMELKSERYPYGGNLGLEIISNQNTGSAGGVFRAKKEHAKYYSHLMIDNVLIIFETDRLLDFVNGHLFKDGKMIGTPPFGFWDVQNASNRTKNWICPISSLETVVLRTIWLNDFKK